jgi:hypothetical protein
MPSGRTVAHGYLFSPSLASADVVAGPAEPDRLDLREAGPLSQRVQAGGKALGICYIHGMEVRKKRPRGFKKRPRGLK